MYVCMYVCYTMLCFSIFIPTSNISYSPITTMIMTTLPKHSLSGHSGRHVRNSMTKICFLFLIICSFQNLTIIGNLSHLF